VRIKADAPVLRPDEPVPARPVRRPSGTRQFRPMRSLTTKATRTRKSRKLVTRIPQTTPQCSTPRLTGGSSFTVTRAKQNISERVQEAAAAHKAMVTKQWVLERLKENVERAMQAVPHLDHEGNPTGEYTYQGKSPIERWSCWAESCPMARACASLPISAHPSGPH
jgi:hypothetical protein